MTVNISDPARLHGLTVNGPDGAKLGTVDGVFLDDTTQRPEWVAVKTGLFGTHVSLVPLAQAELTGEELQVPYDKEALKSAPHHDPDQNLSQADEDELYRHYRESFAGGTAAAGTTGYTGTAAGVGEPAVGHDTSGPSTDEAMTRSEERMRVGTETVQTGRARLRKYVVTEHEQVTVPVSHEEVRVEREPITEANRGQAYAGSEISEEEHEVVLHAERPVVATEAEPVERVRLDTETVTEQQQVGAEVRKERIETEGVDEPAAGGGTDSVDETGTGEFRR